MIGGTPGITVTANSGAGNPPTGYTDVAVDPGDNDATLVQGATLFVAGWACDAETGAPVSRVEVRIDGVRIGNATLGGQRPDVAAVLGSQCLSSGWSFSGGIGMLATGMHTVSVVAVDPGNNAIELGGAKSIEVVPAPTPGWKGYIYFAGQMLAQYSDGTTYFAHKDHLGSTRLLTKPDKSYNPQDVYDYLPFGESSSPGTTTSHKFTGHERDTESGLDYFGARYYASTFGRFESVDPIFLAEDRLDDPQQLNLYAYVRNNPLVFVDPDGEDCQTFARIWISCTWPPGTPPSIKEAEIIHELEHLGLKNLFTPGWREEQRAFKAERDVVERRLKELEKKEKSKAGLTEAEKEEKKQLEQRIEELRPFTEGPEEEQERNNRRYYRDTQPPALRPFYKSPDRDLQPGKAPPTEEGRTEAKRLTGREEEKRRRQGQEKGRGGEAEEMNVPSKLRTAIGLSLVLLLEIVLLVGGLAPVQINSREIQAAHNRYIANPSERTKRDYDETVGRVLGTQHKVKTVALVLGIANLPVIWLCFRKFRKSEPQT